VRLKPYEAITVDGASPSNGLVVDVRLTHATGAAEPEAALDMLGDLPDSGKKTVGAGKNYDTVVFVAARTLGVTPHSWQTTGVSDSFIGGAAVCIRRPVSADRSLGSRRSGTS
jgi:hypothetical protein